MYPDGSVSKTKISVPKLGWTCAPKIMLINAKPYRTEKSEGFALHVELNTDTFSSTLGGRG